MLWVILAIQLGTLILVGLLYIQRQTIITKVKSPIKAKTEGELLAPRTNITSIIDKI